MQTPTPYQRLGYYIGRTLPASLHDWVREDLVGSGAERRLLTRFFASTLPFFLLVPLIPGMGYLLLEVMVLMLVPFIVFTIGLSYAYRRLRLVQHGLDPRLLDRTKHDVAERRVYASHFGVR